MPILEPRNGAKTVQLSKNSSTALPALTTLTFSACAITPTELLINDATSDLSASDTYQVMIGLLGRDATNKGYTIGRCSPSSGNLTITAGQVIQVKVVNTDWPTDFDEAIAAAIFLKINNADFQLAGYGYIDDADDFSHIIMAKPLRVAPKFSNALLQSTTADDILGDRAPLGVTYEDFGLTTGPVNENYQVSTLTVSPNNGPDFPLVTSRGVGVSFSSLINDIREFVRAAAGNYVKYTDGGDVVREAQMSLSTAQALLQGNRPIKLIAPADSDGNQEITLLLGLLTVNQQELTAAWSKTEVTSVNFQFNPASLDKLINNQHTQIVFVRET